MPLIVQRLTKRIRRIGIEENLDILRNVVRDLYQGPAARHGHKHGGRSFFHGQFDYIDRIVDLLYGTAQGNAAGDDKATLQRLSQESGTKPDEDADAKLFAALCGIEGPKLESEFVLARIALTDKLARSCVKVLLCDARAFPEGARR